jgi:LytS/YehU family sensor histidine kinase
LYLIPNFFFKGKYFTYVTICVLLAILFYFFEYYSAQVNLGPFRKYTTAIPKFSVTNFIRESLIPLVFFGTTTGYKVFKKWLIDVQRINELTHTQLKDELNHLKNQVNPHFLFNTLNNLHTLSQINSEKTSKMILGLSDVLRYHIYESSKEYISLSKDIEMLNHYLMLEKIRRDNFKYEIVISSDIKGVLIPPLLFITFVENALKHGVDDREPSYFTMRFNIVDKNLVFEAENSKPSIIIRNKVGGIGLKNIQRRLELLFKNNYKLEIRDSVNSYIVNLQIPI